MKKYRILLFAVMAMGIMVAQAQKPSTYEKEGPRIKVTNYFDDGNVREVGYFVNGKADGSWIEYRADGSIKTKAFYDAGKKTGTWIVYSQDGSSLYELIYTNNSLVDSHKWKIDERNLLADK
jgi:antitoxin component YwqK of YwqJK toxin-antitoxin module